MNKTYAAHGGDAVFLILHLLIIFSFLAMKSDGRYLRPADHGLTTTTTPTRDDNSVPQQQEMSYFFNGGNLVQSNLPLPEAKNITTTSGGGADVVNDDRWKKRFRSREENGSRDQLKEILLVASLVCGVAGIIFLAVSGVIFLFRCRKERSASNSQMSTLTGGGAVDLPNKM